jgi:YqaJ-like viral recombinase domain
MPQVSSKFLRNIDRRAFIGGSEARIIMGADEAALVRLWREKRGEAAPEDLSGDLIVQLGAATEELNRTWYERNTGRHVTDVQRRVRHSAIPWMVATLDGTVEATGAVFESKFMLPWSFSEEAAAEKYMAQVQHNMWVTHLRTSVLSIITGGGKWVEITIPMDPLYLSVLERSGVGGKEVLALRPIRRTAPPDQCRAAPPTHRSRPHRRYEFVEFVGRVRGALSQYPECVSRPRTREERAQGSDAGGCQGGDRPWRAGQALQIGCRKL